MDWQPEGPWRVQLTCRPTPTRVTLEVKQAPSPATVSELANILVLMAASVERVENSAQVQAHLARGSAGFVQQWAGRARRLGSSWKGFAVAGLAMVTLGFWLHEARDAEYARTQTLAEPTLTDIPEGNEPHLVNVDELYQGLIAYPLPSKPFKDQATAPCRPKVGEVEINGGCWLELARRPPCTELQAEYQGKCYLPTSKKRDRLPQSSHP
ncbi:hypothetical protein [Cystobacter ferrugineus]|uniref:hypothetical protein n=1 Tax=Cystobacter ferrugineus TaxID=83449 RepID=UPI001FE820F8|nr:hypothetical protein [Cystobacter ferrugineus]